MITELVVYSIIGVFIGISQSAGIGGGPILNICLMVGFGYSAKKSMSITYLFLIGGATASMWKNFKIIHPQTKKLQMDYDLIMMTLPMAASGSIFGTLSNHFISEMIITLLFTILLSYLSYDTFQKLRSYPSEASAEKEEGLLNKETEMVEIGDTRQVNPELEKIINQQLNPLPMQKLKIAGFIFIYTVIILLFKGGESYSSIIGLESCNTGGYVLITIHLLLSYACAKSIAIKIVEKEEEKEKLGHVYEQGEKMSSKRMWNCMISGFCAGAIGGALGLGGAIILVPVWLNSGIDKLVATSSSAPLIFFSAIISFIMALLAHRYETVMELVFYFLLAFAGAVLVRATVNYIVDTWNLKTMIFILLLITMVSSLVVLLPFQIGKYFLDPEHFMKFGRFC